MRFFSRSLFLVEKRLLFGSSCCSVLARRYASCEFNSPEKAPPLLEQRPQYQFRPPSKEDLVWSANTADVLFRKAIKENDLTLAQYLMFVDFRLNIQEYFKEACGSGSLEIAKTISVHLPDRCDIDAAFRRVCIFSEVFQPEVAQWLISKVASFKSLRDPKTYEYQFPFACVFGSVEGAKFVRDLHRSETTDSLPRVLSEARIHGLSLEMAKWLQETWYEFDWQNLNTFIRYET